MKTRDRNTVLYCIFGWVVAPLATWLVLVWLIRVVWSGRVWFVVAFCVSFLVVVALNVFAVLWRRFQKKEDES